MGQKALIQRWRPSATCETAAHIKAGFLALKQCLSRSLHVPRSRCCRPLPCSSSCSFSVHADRLRLSRSGSGRRRSRRPRRQRSSSRPPRKPRLRRTSSELRLRRWGLCLDTRALPSSYPSCRRAEQAETAAVNRCSVWHCHGTVLEQESLPFLDVLLFRRLEPRRRSRRKR